MNERISQRAVRHGMLVHAVLLEIGHHVSQPCLRSRLRPLLLNLVHLLKILLRRRIQLRSESFLCLQRPCLRFRNLIDFEAAAHS